MDTSQQPTSASKRYDYKSSSKPIHRQPYPSRQRNDTHHHHHHTTQPALTQHEQEILHYIEQIRASQKRIHLERGLRPENESPRDEWKEIWSNMCAAPLIGNSKFRDFWFDTTRWKPSIDCVPTSMNSMATDDMNVFTPSSNYSSPSAEAITIDASNRNNNNTAMKSSTHHHSHQHHPGTTNIARAPSYTISDHPSSSDHDSQHSVSVPPSMSVSMPSSASAHHLAHRIENVNIAPT